MAQYATHVCPNCGRRFKCDQPVRTFASESPTLVPGEFRPWPSIQYEVYYGVRTISSAFYKALAVWIPVNAIAYGIFKYLDAPAFVPIAFNIGTIAACMSTFGKVPSWHNAVQTEAPRVESEPQEPEDKRGFVGWETETHTKTTQHMEWYTSPIPIRQARSFALALVNNGFGWIDERDLSNHKANISQSNYRKLRRDWIDRGLCTETGDRKTAIRAKHTIWRIAFEPPK